MRLPTAVSRRICFLRRCFFVAATLAASLAHADDYAEVQRLIRAGQLTQAAAVANQYLSVKPRDPQMRFMAGVVQTEAGQSLEAIATFTQITQDYPELPEPYNNLAVLYASQSQFDKARAALEMAVRTNPRYATAHENLGDVYARLASLAYSKALQLDSSNTALGPKLTVIRSLFKAEAKTSGKPVSTAPAATPAGPTVALTTKPLPTVAAAAPTAVLEPALTTTTLTPSAMAKLY